MFNDVQKSALANVDKQKEDLKNKDIGKLLDKTMKYIEKSQKDSKKEDKSVATGLGNLSGGINSIVGGLEQLGIEVPEELKSVIAGIQGVSSILTGIATTVIAIQAIAGADALIPFTANGGFGKLPHAALGHLIPGNHFSGDKIFAGGAWVNSGELVLNRAQQGVLASALNDNDHDGGNARPYVSGEQIYLGLNNYLRRTGRGELLTARY